MAGPSGPDDFIPWQRQTPRCVDHAVSSKSRMLFEVYESASTHERPLQSC